MLIYLESQARHYPLTEHILSRFPQAEIIEIKHYKNLFDQRIAYKTEHCIILARLTGKALLPVPASYGYSEHSYFLRTQLNCVYNCEYCYLKGAFKNDFPVYFVNYDEIQEVVRQEIVSVRQSGYDGQIWLYSSNWSDLLGSEAISQFHKYFLPFFETLDGVMVESRTKSPSVQSLLDFGKSFTHTEIAFSLNAEEIIQQFEKGTAPLTKRLQAIQKLLDAGRKVGLRIMPLIPIENFMDVYKKFFVQLKESLDISQCFSIFFGGFLLTQSDLKVMKSKHPESQLWNMLQVSDEKLVRTGKEEREQLYALIRQYFPDARVSMDEL